MLDYIINMIEYVCSGNEKEDRVNIQLLAQSILERSQELQRAQEAKAKILRDQKIKLAQLEGKTELPKEETKDSSEKLPSKEEIAIYLEKIREFYLNEQKKGISHKVIVREVSKSIWARGCSYYQNATNENKDEI